MLDFDELAFQVSEAHRLIENLIRLGTVSSVSGDRCVVVDGSGLKTAPLPWVTRRAGVDRDWWCPSVGEQVVLLCPGGRPEQGVVLPALYSDAFAAPTTSPDVREERYSDGMVVRLRVASEVRWFKLVRQSVRSCAPLRVASEVRWFKLARIVNTHLRALRVASEVRWFKLRRLPSVS